MDLLELADRFRKLGIRFHGNILPREFTREEWSFILDNEKEFRGLIGQKKKNLTISLERLSWLQAIKAGITPEMTANGHRKITDHAVVEYCVNKVAVAMGLVPVSVLVKGARPSDRQKKKPMDKKFRYVRIMKDWK